jgi:hypothetical protein
MENENEINVKNEKIDENLENIKNTLTYTLPLELIFPEKQERHEKCKPPRDAFLFFPKQSDLIDYDEKNPKNSRRKIFEVKTIDGDYDYTEFESENLDLLTKEIQNFISDPKNSNSSLKQFEILKKSEILRFLQSTSFDIKKTILLIKDHLDWKLTNYPIKITEKVSEILNSGFMYMHGRDNHFRPIVVVKAQKYLQLSQKYTLEDFVTATVYFIEYLVVYCLIPGQVECWDIIADMSNVSIMFLPADLVKMFNIFQCHYRARLCTVFVVGMSRILNAVWSVLKKLIDAQTNKKIKFIKDSNTNEIFEFINKEQVEEKYGGSAPDLNEHIGYFPPVCPSLNFFNSEEERRELLISEENYEEMIKLGKINKNNNSNNENYVNSAYNTEQSQLNSRNQNKFEFDNKTIYSIAKSFYEDAMSIQQDEASVYENCKELKSCNGNDLNEKLLDAEGIKGDMIIKEEFVIGNTPQDDQEMELIEKNGIREIPGGSMGEIMRSKGKRLVDVKDLPKDRSK